MNPYPKEVKAKILLHRRISSDSFRLQLACPEIARSARPGQFLLLRINELQDPFLRRPLVFPGSFHLGRRRETPRMRERWKSAIGSWDGARNS
jgi:NAD(P)H-flavin reductase